MLREQPLKNEGEMMWLRSGPHNTQDVGTAGQQHGRTGASKISSETLRRIERQIEALVSQERSLLTHKRAIERQLASIAAHIHEPDMMLIPRTVFLLLEMRGNGGVSGQLEYIARIVHEQGY